MLFLGRFTRIYMLQNADFQHFKCNQGVGVICAAERHCDFFFCSIICIIFVGVICAAERHCDSGPLVQVLPEGRLE